MDKKEIKKQVKQLAKKKEYEQIYKEYGPYYFRQYVSRNYKKQDIKQLKQEGKYLDIYVKYGESPQELFEKDIENEVGEKPSLKQKILHNLKRYWLWLLLGGEAILFLGQPVTEQIKAQIEARKKVDEYRARIERICQSI